jgi:hypothetical protein
MTDAVDIEPEARRVDLEDPDSLPDIPYPVISYCHEPPVAPGKDVGR